MDNHRAREFDAVEVTKVVFNHRDTETPRSQDLEADYEHDPLTEKIIGSAIEVHRYLGPGLLEGIYEDCMCRELSLRGIAFARQCPAPLIYKDMRLECPLRIDLIVQHQVVVELKSVEKLTAVHQAQLLTYLRLTGLKTGLLVNFNCAILADGVKRVSL